MHALRVPVAGSCVMGLGLWLLLLLRPSWSVLGADAAFLAVSVCGGGALYVLTVYLLAPGDARETLMSFFHSRGEQEGGSADQGEGGDA